MNGTHVPDVMFGSALAMGALSTVMSVANVEAHGVDWFVVLTLVIAVSTIVGSAVALYSRWERRKDRVWWTR